MSPALVLSDSELASKSMAERLDYFKAGRSNLPPRRDRTRRSAIRERLDEQGVVVPELLREEARQRVLDWEASIQPRDAVERDLVHIAANATSAMHRLWIDIDVARARAVDKAERTWDFDRMLDAEAIADKLAKQPGKTVARLRQTLHGANWMLDRWLRLAARLEQGRDLSPILRELALNLLAVPHEFREQDSPLDLVESSVEDQVAHRLAIARREIRSLRLAIEEDLAQRDAEDRELTIRHAIMIRDDLVRRLENQEKMYASRIRAALRTIAKMRRENKPKSGKPASEKTKPKPVDPPCAIRPEDLEEALSTNKVLPPPPNSLVGTLEGPDRATFLRKLLEIDERMELFGAVERIDLEAEATLLDFRVEPPAEA